MFSSSNHTTSLSDFEVVSLFILAFLMDTYDWYFIVALICISLIIIVKHLLVNLMPVHKSSFGQHLQIFCPLYFLIIWLYIQFSSAQSLSRVRLFATPWIAAHQASLSITNSQRLLKLMSIESVMLSSHLILCLPLLLLLPIPPSIRVFSNESTIRMRWPK